MCIRLLVCLPVLSVFVADKSNFACFAVFVWQAAVCRACGGILSTVTVSRSTAERNRQDKCLGCGSIKVAKVRIPYVFKYLSAELAGMNLNMGLDVSEI